MVIKSVSFSQEQIIRDIMTLHMSVDYFDVDPTYSKGVFYKNMKQPTWKSDITPQIEGVIEANSIDLHYLDDESVGSVMFDPPFVINGTKKESTGLIRKRFGDFYSIKEMYEYYNNSLVEFYRVMKKNGVLVFKCQDTVSSGKQHLSHVKIINMAEELGFYTKDLFILEAKSRMLDSRIKQQKHARKFHSYFLVFIKK